MARDFYNLKHIHNTTPKQGQQYTAVKKNIRTWYWSIFKVRGLMGLAEKMLPYILNSGNCWYFENSASHSACD